MFNRKKRRPNNAIVEAAHPKAADLLCSIGKNFSDTVEPAAHSIVDHWVSLAVLFVTACGLLWASAQGWIS